MPRRKQSVSRKRKAAPTPPRYPKRVRPLKDQEIIENLVAESDDDCSNFDDSDADPDFFLQSDCDTNSEQSDDEEVQNTLETVNAQTEGVLQRASRSHLDIVEPISDSGAERTQNSVDQSQRQSQSQESSTVERLRNFYGKNRHKWSSAEPSRTTRVRLHNIFNIGTQVSPSECHSFGDAWKLFFTDDMLDRIVEHTNLKLIEYRAKYIDVDRSELVPMTNIELKALMGLLFYSSVFQSNHENADFIFATDAILELFNEFIKNCKQHFTLGTQVCIDEMLAGCLEFRMYMPNKPTKYGIKVLLLVDCDTFYTYNAYIYHGKRSDGEGLNDAEKKLGIPSQSVIRLCKGIENSNRNVTADNWFTSIELLNALKELARHLVLPVMKLRVYNDRMPRELRLTIMRVIGPDDMPELPAEAGIMKPGVRKTCAICPSRLKRRTKYSCCKCDKPMCLACCCQICSDCKLGC